jgi:hypothetical protein
MTRATEPPLTNPLPYARPTTLQRVLRELDAADRLSWTFFATKLAIGVPLCLVGPAFVTLLIKSIERNAGARLLPGFLATFCLVTLVLFPLMLWYERRTAGEFLSDAVRGEPTDRPSSYGEYELRTTKLAWTAYVEIALTGPRLAWEVVDGSRGRSRVDPVERQLAAEIVADLFDAGQGVPTKTLFKPGRHPKQVVAAVEYLARREWIGTSKTRDRIWLSSPARERLGGGTSTL